MWAKNGEVPDFKRLHVTKTFLRKSPRVGFSSSGTHFVGTQTSSRRSMSMTQVGDDLKLVSRTGRDSRHRGRRPDSV